MVPTDFLAREQAINKTENVRNFEQYLTDRFNNKVELVEKEIVRLKNLVALNTTISLN